MFAGALVPVDHVIEFLNIYSFNSAIVGDCLLLLRMVLLTSAERIVRPRALLQAVYTATMKHNKNVDVVSAALAVVLVTIPGIIQN